MTTSLGVLVSPNNVGFWFSGTRINAPSGSWVNGVNINAPFCSSVSLSAPG
ncbi:hypothetical protein [Vulcanisaeta distributa]|uniref:hypothetical protein n=1 Tax=Vulcanisaeta distributa TaxID=164451 RepID=UPI001493E2B6|nr:hypothetical protein [Vulcanisaeta distributa]